MEQTVEDRRGDVAEYDLQREAEDVRAVLDAIGQPAHVLGHSYDGLCALEAALLTLNMDRLVLYESVPLRGSDRYGPGLIDRLEALLAAGEVESALATMLSEVGGLTPDEIDMLRAQPDAWAIRLANTPSMPRELRAEQRYAFTADRFANLSVPTLLLVGENSPPHELADAQTIAAALPDARVRELPGQQHIAMHTAPGMFVDEMVRFLAG